MTAATNDLARRSFVATAWFTAGLAVLLFLPAWTLAWWQAWVFLAVFGGMCVVGTLYFLRRDPALIERRLAIGPAAEKEPSQKRIMSWASACIVFLYIVPGLDRHFHWSDVPLWLVVLGDAGVVLGFLAILRVFKENSYASATIETAAGQKVIATGPYAYVRHPMYTGALLLFGATPLALGSYWGLLVVIPLAGLFAWRLTDEERFLLRDLPGYGDYRRAVPHRLVPWLW
jgi:protein-S-isoprenylcysteine O-methyltransferase Ste14